MSMGISIDVNVKNQNTKICSKFLSHQLWQNKRVLQYWSLAAKEFGEYDAAMPPLSLSI